VARAVDWFNGHVIDLAINGTGWVAMRVARATYWFDQQGVDGVFNASAAATGGTGGLFRLLQSGRIQQYVFLIVAGTVALVAGFIIF
jgi:NADH:ubiquinone oxidoreductase subunit 5 (subunit L)/multisubunit Na+/H+ antiporter MnhA subunit